MTTNMEKNVFISQQKSILLTEKARVTEELKSISKFPEYGDTDEANAQEIERFEEYKGMEIKLKKFQREIEVALSRIEAGKYGWCENCHEEIDKGRLEAFPAATTCVKCTK